jgi:hypothetical protein
VPEEKHKKKKKTGLLQASLSKNKVHLKTLLNNVSNTIISLDHKLLQNITSRSGIRNTCLLGLWNIAESESSTKLSNCKSTKETK